jgi:hypothetical protein
MYANKNIHMYINTCMNFPKRGFGSEIVHTRTRTYIHLRIHTCHDAASLYVVLTQKTFTPVHAHTYIYACTHTGHDAASYAWL